MKAQWLDLAPEAYHSDYSAVSKSMLWRGFGGKKARRRAFFAEYEECSREPEPPSDAMRMGTLAHAGLLNPETFEEQYAVYPDSVLGAKGRLGTTASNAFEAEQLAAGRIPIKADDMAIVRAMVGSVKAKLANWLKLPSIRERPIYWTNAQTGILCRCMPDWLIIVRDTAFGFDLKTTGSAHPDDFAKKCADFGYWCQESHYSEGISAVTGLKCEFRFVVVESEYPHVTAIEEIAPIHRQDAIDTRLQMLKALKECRETGRWEEPWEREIQPVSLWPGAFDTAA